MNFADKSVRESWQTVDSAASILDGIDMILPTSPIESCSRASMSSIATVLTSCSADAVISRTLALPPRRDPRSRISGPVDVSEWDDDAWSDPDDAALGLHLADSFPLPCFEIPEVAGYIRPRGALQYTQAPVPSLPPSPAASTAFSVSTVTCTPTSEKLVIKAGYNNSIVILRVAWDISYKDMRQHLYNKFVGQEGIPLSDSFTVTYLQPIQTNVEPNKPTEHSNSLSSEPHQVHLVTSQADWENVTASIEGFKLTLRITDDTPST